jgi:hypothetical protein
MANVVISGDTSGAITLAAPAVAGTNTLTLPAVTATVDAFASGTKLLFQQTSAPTGWTKDTSQNNKALRVVSGTASTGGSVAFTTAFASGSTGNTTITTSTMASHNHSYSGGPFGTPFPAGGLDSSGGGAAFAGFTINNTGGDGAHSHSLSLDVQYVDVIIATKD